MATITKALRPVYCIGGDWKELTTDGAAIRAAKLNRLRDLFGKCSPHEVVSVTDLLEKADAVMAILTDDYRIQVADVEP